MTQTMVWMNSGIIKRFIDGYKAIGLAIKWSHLSVSPYA